MTDTLAAKQNWEQGSLARTLKKAPERKPEFTTSSDIPLDRVCTLQKAGSLGIAVVNPYR